MGVDMTQKYCKTCQRDVLAQRSGTNHLLHLLLTFLTGGFWLIVWILCAIRFGGWRCTICGTSMGRGFSLFTFFMLAVLALILFGIWSFVLGSSGWYYEVTV